MREADAMDATQNVFVVVHRKLSGFEERSDLTTWLFGICRRVALDYRRSPRIRLEVPVDALHIGSLRGLERPLDELEPKESPLVPVAEALLDRLPDKLRVVFILFELDEMSGDDIAALLDVPVGTVRSRLRLARQAFRRETARLERISRTRRHRASPTQR
jgi:RNA polymerase sigma-70 factor (ECF subfamily)